MMTRRNILLVAFFLAIHAVGVSASSRCAKAQSTVSENPAEFYYAQFAGILVPIPSSLVVVPRESSEREFSVAFMLDFEVVSRSKLRGSGVSSIFISKGGSGLATDRYDFESEELCVVGDLIVSHLAHSQTEVSVDEIIYVSSPNGENLLVGGSNLSDYKDLLINALAEREALNSERSRSQEEGGSGRRN